MLLKVIWNHKNTDTQKVHDSLVSTPWDVFFIDDNVNDICVAITKFLKEVVSECVPHKEVTIRPRDKPFMTGELRRKMRERDRAYKKAKKSRSENDWLRFCQQRNLVVDLLRQAKRDYYAKVYEVLSSKFTEPKKWLETLKLACGWCTYKKVPPLFVNNQFLFEPLEKANALNTYFSSQWNIDEESEPLPELQPKTNLKLENFEISENEVLKLLQKFAGFKVGRS